MILAVALFSGCIKDNYQEIVGKCPEVLSVNPSNGATNVPFNQRISIVFNERMNISTINAQTFSLRGAAPVSGVFTYADSIVVFTPSTALSPNTTYTGKITTAVKDLAGNALQTDYIWSFSTGAFFIDLQSVARFGIIASTGVANVAGQSEIRNMDVGISPGLRSAVTGFPPAIIVNGLIYASNDLVPEGIPAMLVQAKAELIEAYLATESLVFPAATALVGDVGGRTLSPGIYKSNSTLLIQAGDLTLDAQGNQNAVWIFQVASGLNTIGGAGGNVILKNGANANNVFWQVGSSATIGDYTAFKGNVMALTSITMNAGAIATGRMLAINGSVVLSNANIIEKP